MLKSDDCSKIITPCCCLIPTIHPRAALPPWHCRTDERFSPCVLVVLKRCSLFAIAASQSRRRQSRGSPKRSRRRSELDGRCWSGWVRKERSLWHRRDRGGELAFRR